MAKQAAVRAPDPPCRPPPRLEEPQASQGDECSGQIAERR